MASSDLEHVNLLCLFPRESDLQAAKDVFEHDTGSKFVLDPRRLQVGARICQKWKSNRDANEISVLFASQTKSGGTECSSRLSELASHYSADLAVMAGTCTGLEDADSRLQHASVLVVRKATLMAGLQSTGLQSTEFRADAEYAELESELVKLIDPFITTEIDGVNGWLDVIPDHRCCPSPRYAREIVIEMLSDSRGLAKRDVLGKVQQLQQTVKRFSAMDSAKWGYIIRTMMNDSVPWIEVIDDELCILKNTKRAVKYYNAADHFPRKDQVGVSLCTIGSMDWQLENLASEINELRRRMATKTLVAVDQESYQFMKLCPSILKGSRCLVVKGMSEYCPGMHGQPAVFETYAACTAAAFLRSLVTKRQSNLFKTSPVVPSDSQISISDFDFSRRDVVDATLRAVQSHAATRAQVIGMAMGLTQDHIKGLVHHVVEPCDQVRVIFGANVSRVGTARAARQLLMACKTISGGNFQVIVDEIRREVGN